MKTCSDEEKEKLRNIFMFLHCTSNEKLFLVTKYEHRALLVVVGQKYVSFQGEKELAAP